MADPESRKTFAALVESIIPGTTLNFLEEGKTVTDLVKAGLGRGATLIVAGGGDGTVNSVATELVGTETTLGVLPLGTLNHFAKDLGIPIEIEDALKVLANGRPMNVDVGTVGDRIFLNNSGLGLYPDMVYNREQRQRKGLSKWPAVVLESVLALRRYRLLRLDISIDGKEVKRRTPAVFVGNNDYSLEGTLASKRTSLRDGALCVYIPQAQARLGLMWLSLRAFFGNPQTDLDKFTTTEFCIGSRHKILRVSIDGEVTTMKTPIDYAIRKGALRVMVPAQSSTPSK